MLELGKPVALHHAWRQRAAQQRERMAARGEPQHPVFGEHPLGGLETSEAESFVRMVECQLELTSATGVWRAALRIRGQPQPHLPHQLAPRETESVTPAHPHEMLDRGALELGWRSSHEIADALVRATLPLEHDRGGRVLTP